MKIKSLPQNTLTRPIFGLIGLLILVAVLGTVFTPEKKAVVPTATSFPSIDFDNPDYTFLLKPSSFEAVLWFFKDKTIFLSAYDEAASKFPKNLREKLKTRGGEKLSNLAYRQSYAAILQAGKFTAEAASDSTVVSLTKDNYTIFSGGNTAGNTCFLAKEDKKYPLNERGLNLFILNDDGDVMAWYNFDFYENENPLATGRLAVPIFQFLDKIEIIVKEDKYLKLKQKRDKTMKQQVLLSEDDDLVPARLVYQGKKHKGEIRLKGDWVDHLDGDQWSFRVKLKAGETLMGMRKFSLHHPKTRNYAGEWLFHQLLEDADILNLQYHFVQVELTVVSEFGKTKKQLGVYALEEFFDKYMIERSQRKESVILKVNEDPIWKERADFFSKGLSLDDLKYYSEFDDLKHLNILPFGEKKVRADSNLFKIFLAGQSLFKGYIEGKLKTSEVFDLEKLAKYNAICNILGANHALIGHNYRVYYNPINGRLEPIGFDANAGIKEWYFFIYHHGENDIKYLEAYAKALEEVTSEAYFDKLMNWPNLNEKIAFLQSAYPEYEWLPSTFVHNRKVLQQLLAPADAMHAFFIEMDDEYLRLDIENFSRLALEITGLKNENNRTFAKPSGAYVIPPRTRLTVSFKLDKNYQRLFVNKKKHKAKFDLIKDLNRLNIQYKTLGTSIPMKAKIIPWQKEYDDITAANLFTLQANVSEFDFLGKDENKKIIACKSGSYRMERTLIIPKGYTFKIPPGTRIELMERVKIVSYGALDFQGSIENPIEISSITGLGQGIIVFNTKDTSILNYCKFTNLAQPTTKAWAVTGAVNFYDAPVKISNTSFSKNRCEDALNIVKTYFELDNVIFQDIFSDAFDGDFVTGSIKNSLFGDLGNDAIDISGSSIHIENVIIKNAGDKGLSAGENSQMTVSNITIENSEIAVAAKDKSSIKLSKGLLLGNKLAFTAFQKKSEFGPAFITATGLETKENTYIFLIEKGSSLSLDNKIVKTVENVKERMYGIEFGKKSKR